MTKFTAHPRLAIDPDRERDPVVHVAFADAEGSLVADFPRKQAHRGNFGEAFQRLRRNSPRFLVHVTGDLQVIPDLVAPRRSPFQSRRHVIASSRDELARFVPSGPNAGTCVWDSNSSFPRNRLTLMGLTKSILMGGELNWTSV